MLVSHEILDKPSVSGLFYITKEWELQAEQFNAVLSANAFHWIPSAIRYAKAAAALHDKGFLILLWALRPEPRYEVHQALQEGFQAYAPSFARYEGAKIQAEILEGFEQEILDSGCFEDLMVEQTVCRVTHSIDDYLRLLSTMMGRLEPQAKELLFAELRERLGSFGDQVQLSFLSAVHVARRNS